MKEDAAAAGDDPGHVAQLTAQVGVSVRVLDHHLDVRRVPVLHNIFVRVNLPLMGV